MCTEADFKEKQRQTRIKRKKKFIFFGGSVRLTEQNIYLRIRSGAKSLFVCFYKCEKCCEIVILFFSLDYTHVSGFDFI